MFQLHLSEVETETENKISLPVCLPYKKNDTIVLIWKENDTKGISSCIYSNKNHSGSHTKFHVLQSVFLKKKKEIRL